MRTSSYKSNNFFFKEKFAYKRILTEFPINPFSKYRIKLNFRYININESENNASSVIFVRRDAANIHTPILLATSVSKGRLCVGCGRVPGFRSSIIPGFCYGNTVKLGSRIVHILSFHLLFVSS